MAFSLVFSPEALVEVSLSRARLNPDLLLFSVELGFGELVSDGIEDEESVAVVFVLDTLPGEVAEGEEVASPMGVEEVEEEVEEGDDDDVFEDDFF